MNSLDFQIPELQQWPLIQSNQAVNLFKAVRTNFSGVTLTRWRTISPTLNEPIQWGTQYTVNILFASYDADPREILGSFPIEQGQTISLNSYQVTPDGTPGAITLHNDSTETMYCGFAEVCNISMNQICTMLIPPGETCVIAPMDRVLITVNADYANEPLLYAMPNLVAAGLLVDQSNGPADSVVQYDMNTGWSGGPETTPYPAGTELVPLMILPLT
ncbi:MAG: hypothetical protein ACAH11_11790 [Sphingomonas sp.]